MERRHRHVVEVGFPLLAQSSVPLIYWPFAFQSATYLINRLPTAVLSYNLPYEILYYKLPNYSFLRVFGCKYFPCLKPFNKHKLAYRFTVCTFIGYSSKG